ncbi:unnamed protein product [Kuraishia capsulata CBS 1993]|uniref:Bul1 N-terminal domain-containing protein n=1 Tax=Kuraishia capsulata CBS 1993 TaxID=1382522 RepID=W6MFG4_9ASCO|nr:uncharacterized protein KUCA_T00000499001 [Kuraishia capsulata CBS 1993]CDK24534.1 unnamed protein product [Kuraishia capsulata CBS 1993]
MPNNLDSAATSVISSHPTLSTPAGSSVWPILHKLPKVKAPISVSIRITKKFPRHHRPLDLESPLREYTSGEYIFGSVVVRNDSDQPIKFDSFYVTFEGNSIVGRRQLTFLRIFDARASWHEEGALDDGAEVCCQTKDKLDQTQYGFTDDRILQPFEGHKKFFAFRFPKFLLVEGGNSDDVDEHMFPPPTIGFPSYEEVEINRALGYGRLPKIGSPFKFTDFAPDGASISYTINARMFGRTANNGNSGFNILGENSFHLKFVPTAPMVEIGDSLGTRKVLDHERLWHVDSWHQYKRVESEIKKEVMEVQEKYELWKLGVDDDDKQEVGTMNQSRIDDKKQLQLYVPKDESVSCSSSTEASSTDFSRIYAALVPSKFKAKLLGGSASNKSSKAVITVAPSIPSSEYNPPDHLFFKYRAPKNFVIELLNFQGSDGMPSLGNIPFDFEFTQLGDGVKPPKIEKLTVNLKILNSMVEYPAPMEFDARFANMPKENLSEINRKYRDIRNHLCKIESDIAGECPELQKKLRPSSRLKGKCESLSSLKFSSRSFQLYSTKNIEINWKNLHDNGRYGAVLEIPPILQPLRDLHQKIAGLNLVPAFQSFFLSRSYAIEVKFKFSGYGNEESLMIPADFLR